MTHDPRKVEAVAKAISEHVREFDGTSAEATAIAALDAVAERDREQEGPGPYWY